MNHRKARRLLSSLPDGLLPAHLEGQVRRHVSACPRCANALAEIEATETLLLRLPAGLVPREASPTAEARLARLALWAVRPRPPRFEWVVPPTFGSMVAAVIISLGISVGDWTRRVDDPTPTGIYASLQSEVPTTPAGWR